MRDEHTVLTPFFAAIIDSLFNAYSGTFDGVYYAKNSSEKKYNIQMSDYK